MRHFEFLMRAKYHLEVCARLMQGYEETEEKRFLVGFIRELARAVSAVIASTLTFEKINAKTKAKRLSIFTKKAAPRHFKAEDIINMGKILEIERAQNTSAIEFSKGGTIILLINGKYRFLKRERLREFFESVQKCSHKLTSVFRQV